jgi:hypothetical protein
VQYVVPQPWGFSLSPPCRASLTAFFMPRLCHHGARRCRGTSITLYSKAAGL